MAKSHDMSLCEIDNMIRIYSDKIFQLQEQGAKLIGSTFYTLGATKKSGKTAYDKLQIKIAGAEIEAELLVKTKGEINAEFPDTDDELFIWMQYLESKKLVVPILELPPWSKIIDIDEYIAGLIHNELPLWSEEIDIDEYIRELEIEEINRDCEIIDIDEYIAELEIMKIKQEYSFIDIDDELPPWYVIIDIDDYIDELETAEFF